ncbi:sensor histidine kinase [Dictyobacter arantiisoli]|uniref:Oxygen sensor histidine kinase NreB n=1 Tax=Dictyobacter arantiisoli TaxID=2014874 RepID=A0A5A5T6B7_9CHLR|nr:sensor histidine kinase [Dictyobacter arantiisoli]GCF07000.1 hypothetical protein KDI_05640 [Dictyobacter arantiisoli]
MQREKMYRIPVFLFLQLLISYVMVGFVVAILLSRYGIVLSLVIGCGVGLLLSANLSQGVFALQVVLDRLAEGLPVELTALRRYWPLHTLFQRISRLEQQYRLRSGQQIQVEQQTVAYKDQLMQQVIKTTAQEERNRLARDLHDSIKQQIFSITMSAAAARARWERDQPRVRSILDDIERTAREAQVEMQAMLQQLRPRALENIGLIESLRMQSQALEYRTGANVALEISTLPSEEDLPPGSQEVLFRIVQEGFANIARHARASNVWLSLYQQGQFLLLEIGDDGQGFNISHMPKQSNAGGMGMQNIQERIKALHGTVQIWSVTGTGTTIQIAIPLAEQAAPERIPEVEEPALRKSMKRVQLMLEVGLRMIDVAAACVLLYTPIGLARPLLILCLFGAGCAWLMAQTSRMQVALSMGSKHIQHLSLVAQSDQLLIGFLIIGTCYIGYSQYYYWLFAGLFYLFAAFVLVLAVHYYVVRWRYSRKLTRSERRKLIRKQARQIGLDLLVWASVIGYSIYRGIITLNARIFTFDWNHWAQSMAVLFCLLWLLVILLKGIEMLCWRWLPLRRERSER